MSTVTVGLFTDNKAAGNAVAELKQQGYTDQISLIAKDKDGDVSSHQVKDDAEDGAMVGAGLGALVGLFTGVIAAVLPGAALVVAGPLAVAWGVTGTALGALTGGLVGALVDWGIDEQKAKVYEEHILKGDVLITVTGDDDKKKAAYDTFDNHGAIEILQFPETVEA